MRIWYMPLDASPDHVSQTVQVACRTNQLANNAVLVEIGGRAYQFYSTYVFTTLGCSAGWPVCYCSVARVRFVT